MMDYFWQCGSLLLIVLGPIPFVASVMHLQRRAVGTPCFARECLMVLTAWCGIEVLVGMCLGSIQSLRLHSVLISESALLLTGIAILSLLRRRSPLVRQSHAPLSESESSLFFMGTLILIGIALLWTVGVTPVTDFDSLWYHLPTMVHWYQSGTFATPDKVTVPAYYPFSWELLSLLFLLPFQADAFVAVPNFIAWIIFGFSIYAVSGMCGASRLSSLLACVLTLSAPMVTAHVLSLHVDFPMAAFFLSGLYFLLSCQRSRSSWDYAFFAVSLGLLCGIKTTGLLYGGLLCASLLLLEMQASLIQGGARHEPSARHPLFQAASLVAVGLAAIVAGYWYLRNFLEIGNPFGPFRVAVAGVTIFPGTTDLAEIRRTTSLAGLFSLRSVAHWKTFVGALKENFSIPLILLFGSVGFLPFRIMNKDQPVRRRELALIAALAIGAACLYWMTPYSAEDLDRTHQGQITPFIGDAMRYAFPLVGLLAIAGATALSMFPIREGGYLVMGATAVGMYFDHRTMLLLVWVGFVMVWSVPTLRGKVRLLASAASVLPVRVGMVMLCLLLAALAGRVGMQERAEKKVYSYGYFGILDFLDVNVNAQDSIGYFTSQPTYVLFGKNLNRRVVYVDASSLSLSQWVDRLKENNVRVVALGPIDGPTMLRQELVWLESPDSPFTRIYGQNVMGETLLYRLK